MGDSGDNPPLKHQGSKTKSSLKNAGIGIEGRRRSSAAMNYRIENNKVVIVNEDGTTQELEIVKSKDKHGKLRRAVPALPIPMAVVCLILNLVPGLGTLVSGFGALCGYKSELESKCSTLCWNVVAALLQIILTPILVGWIWSLHRGVLLVQKSLDKKIDERDAERSNDGPT